MLYSLVFAGGENSPISARPQFTASEADNHTSAYLCCSHLFAGSLVRDLIMASMRASSIASWSAPAAMRSAVAATGFR